MRAQTTFPLVFSTVRPSNPTIAKGKLADAVPTGSWTQSLEPGKASSASTLNSNKVEARTPLEYNKEDIQHIEKWSK